MHVKKRNGSIENVSFDKVLRRIEKLCNLNPKLDMNFVDAAKVSMKVIEGIYSGVTTCKLDNLATETCAMMSIVHPDYGILAARVFVSNLHKETESEFSSIVERLHNNIHPVNRKLMPLVNDEFYADVMANRKAIDEAIDHMRDYELTYFGLRTLERAYLLRMTGDDSKENIVERPQHLFMRVSVALHGRDMKKIIETYNAMSRRYFIHATPTLFNAGTRRAGLSSCFLLTATAEDDSIENIYKLLGEMAVISKYSGGIGISLHDIRAKGSLIMSTNGKSEGLIPLMGVFNKSAKYVTQSNKRPGSIAVYLEPWHAEIFEFLKLRENNGLEDLRARDLFYGLWIPDLFMEKARKDEDWCLFCPNEAPGLADVYGKEFEQLYNRYESQGLYRRKVKAQKLLLDIIESQIRTGGPYMLYKDAVNRKNNQKHVGTIRSSNLCTEIVQYTSHEESAVCNLASLCLPTYVQIVPGGSSLFDFRTLYEMVKIVTRNLDRVIDITHYPVEKARYSNMRHRPIGIGISGLADTFSLMKMPFDSIEAKELNKNIFETIYFAAAEASMEMAKEKGTYETYPGSEFSKGKFQWDLWTEESGIAIEHSGMWDWEELRRKMIVHGMRNSLLTAPMPTASTSQIMGVSECFEVRNSNIYKRQTLSGEFQMVNTHLLKDLCELGIWNNSMKQMIIENKGSVQGIPGIPKHIQKLYETSWEVSQKVVIQLSADRGPYVDQSQSLNIFMEDPTYKKLMSMHFYGYDRKLKTGMYYLKMKSATAPLQFSVVKTEKDAEQTKDVDELQVTMACSMYDKECLSCSA
ncbi:ribonucleotide reductase M1 [Blyttiomyces helicus]|uniref:Ribonucleoside-diphosphate reductase n=1 Tax=Blyttiomyces helicus TaxID=388810 RepID=A0A4P9WJ79_9FUNG|nr:ribonucleotide reductase M1 [Blyttiomyces helicus]|eukprot:RKO92969.1 ribonucleotide reductase M1 [Blyttiomyces helicus]